MATQDRQQAVTRRRFLSIAAWVGGGVGAVPLLQACGAPAAPTAAPTAAPPTAPAAPTPAPAATAPTPAAKAPVASGQAATVSIHWRNDAPVSLNPLFSTSGQEQMLERLLFGALLKINDKLEPVPDLAERWEASPDAKTYTFYLHKSIKFSDGTPLTADDVMFTFERAIDKRTGSYWFGRLRGIDGAAAYAEQKAEKVAGLEAPDKYTFRIKLAKPDAAFLTTLGDFSGMGILPKHILQEVPPDQLRKHSFSLSPTVGAGAFTFVKNEAGQYVELKRNDNYFRGKVALERIFLKILNPDVGLAQLDAGDVDYTNIPIGEMERIKRNAKLVISSIPSPSLQNLAINTTRPYFQDKRVRQAMWYAIDRQGIVDSILGGQARVVNSPIFGPAWMGEPQFNKYPFDPAKAKALLKEAGWNPSQKVELMGKSSGTKEQAAYLPVIQKQLRDVGMDVNVALVDNAGVQERFVAKADYDLRDNGGGVYGAEPANGAVYFHGQQHMPAGLNYSRYSNPKLDELIDSALAVSDQAKRKVSYTEVVRIINEEAPTVFLWVPNSVCAFNKRLQGFKPTSYLDNYLWNAEEWSIGS